MADRDFNIPIVGKIRIINFPKTMTVLALGMLSANILFPPVIAVIGPHIPEEYTKTVETTAALFKDGLLLILGYYFRDKTKQTNEADDD